MISVREKGGHRGIDALPYSIMGRIDPVECIGVSGQRNGNVLNVKPPAMRVRDVCYTKNHLSVIIGLFRPLLRKER